MAKKPGNARTISRTVPTRAASPARGRRKPAAPRSAGASEEAPYHHGALRDALLEAAERVLERDGLAGLTLRAVAREAGVSHAAPTHHFGDLTGLVSELAAIGFRQFNTAMVAAGSAAGPALMEKALAKQLGVRFVLSTDSHQPGNLPFMRYAVDLARRGGLEPGDILNTRPLGEFRKGLKRAGSEH